MTTSIKYTIRAPKRYSKGVKDFQDKKFSFHISKCEVYSPLASVSAKSFVKCEGKSVTAIA
jgi:hypothetical protein